jgi:surface carbohydrate biosynthesis protein
LPIETVIRELDAKLLLSAAAVSRGYCVVIGRKTELLRIAKENGRGIFLYKSNNDAHVESYFRPLRGAGVISSAIDEEGFVWPSSKEYLRARVGAGQAFDWLSFLFVWGAEQESWLRQGFPHLGFENLHVTGNVRFDILREPYKGVFSDRADQLRKRHDDFVLINTKFAPGNLARFYNMSHMEKMRKSGKIKSSDDDLFFQDKGEYLKKLWGHYVRAVRFLARQFPDINFVVRPHPSEEKSTWENSLSDIKNAYVQSDGNVVPWIMASKAVVHTNCTTGIEAFVARKPVFRYHPEYDERYESEFPNSLGHGFANVEELSLALRRVVDEAEDSVVGEQQVGGREVIKHYLENYDRDYSYQRILDAYDGMLKAESLDGRVSCLSVDNSIKSYAKLKLTNLFRQHENILAAVCGSSFAERTLKRSQKFPGISRLYVRKMVEAYFDVSLDLQKTSFKVSELGQDCFLIAPSGRRNHS